MALAYDKPNEKLAAELRQVARSAEALVRALDQTNVPLPEGFPHDALRDEGTALMGLPEGTAEGCRVQLDLATALLPKFRREHFLEDSEEVGQAADKVPPMHRDSALDQRLVALIAAVTTARDEYRDQAQDRFDDTTRTEATITVDRPTRAELAAGADEITADVNEAVSNLDDKGVSETPKGDVLRRNFKDTTNLSFAARAQISAGRAVRRWLAALGVQSRRLMA